ncbi:MAG: M56 family metallopeptidase [Candidatus Hydrogenedentes bacterium]|nr:M56 family metallopeptidase [Candidatus Hydrogenedentota bacterium]
MVWLLTQHLVVCGLLAVVVATACRIFKLAPATRHALWLVVLVKVLLPLPVMWPWSIPLPETWIGQERAAPAIPYAAGPTIQIPKPPADEIAPATSPPAAPANLTEQARWTFPKLTRANAGHVALALWVAVGVTLLGVQLANHARFLRRTRRTQPTPEWLAEFAATISEQLGVAPPGIRIVDAAPSPYVYGLRRANLIIPAALLDAVPRERWSCILVHELAHLKRRDHWVRWLELVTGGVWFWNPVYWIARRNLRANAELACDAWVVWALPDQRRAYAETLIDVSELIAKSAVPIAALGIGARGVRIDFERRLTMILHGRNAQRTTWKAAALVCVLALVALPGWPEHRTVHVAKGPATSTPQTAAEAPQPASEKRTTPEKALSKPVAIEFQDQHISKIIEFLADFVSVNIVVDHRAVKPGSIVPKGTLWQPPSGRKVSAERTYVSDGLLPPLDLKGATTRAILDEWTGKLKLTYKVLPARILITTPDQIEKDGALLDTDAYPKVQPARMDSALNNTIDWSNGNEHIAVAAGKLMNTIFVPITVDARVVSRPDRATPSYAEPVAVQPPPPDDPELDRLYVTDGMVQSIRLEEVPLADALKALTEPLNLAYRPTSNFIWLTAAERIDKDEFADPPVPANAKELGAKLQQPVAIEFDNTHVSRILEFISGFASVNLVLDQRAVPPPSKERQRYPAYLVKTGDKFTSTGYVPYIKLEDTPLKEALKALLVPLDLTYRVEEHTIFVSTPELISSSQVEPKDSREAEPAKNQGEPLRTPVSIEFDGAHVSRVVKYMSEIVKDKRVNIIIDPRAVKPAPQNVGLPVPGVPGAQLPAPGSAGVTAPPPAGTAEQAKSDADQMYTTDGIVPYIKLDDVPLDETLQAILRPLNLAYEERPGFVWITSKDRIGADDWSDPPTPGDAKEWVKKLDARVAFEFDNTHITNIVEFMGSYLKMDIRCDARAVPAQAKPVPGSPTSPFTMKDGKPVATGYCTYVKFVDVTFREGLKAMLIPMGLTYRVTPDYLVVTSPELARETKQDEWANVPYLGEQLSKPVIANP